TAHQLVQPRRQLDVDVVAHHLERGMRHAAKLPTDRLDDLRMIVADVLHADAADEIDIPPSLHVPEIGAFGLLRKKWMGGDDTVRHMFGAGRDMGLVGLTHCMTPLSWSARSTSRVGFGWVFGCGSD